MNATPAEARVLIHDQREIIYAAEAEIGRVMGLLDGVCIEDDLHVHKAFCLTCGWDPRPTPACPSCGEDVRQDARGVWGRTSNLRCPFSPDGKHGEGTVTRGLTPQELADIDAADDDD